MAIDNDRKRMREDTWSVAGGTNRDANITTGGVSSDNRGATGNMLFSMKPGTSGVSVSSHAWESLVMNQGVQLAMRGCFP